MCGSATLATDVSRATIKVGRIIVVAINHGWNAGIHAVSFSMRLLLRAESLIIAL